MNRLSQATGPAWAWMLAATAMLLLAGCAHPWDRDLLAKREMQLNTHPVITAAREHIYFSKEGQLCS